MTFILVHGSWHTGETWYKVIEQLEAAGHTAYAPTLSGMASKKNPGGPEINVSIHVQDIINLIESYALQDVILVGHSYSGLLITAVANRLPEHVTKLIYLDAFIPDNNQSLFDIIGEASEKGTRSGLVDANGKSKADGAQKVWLIPPGNARDYLGDDASDELESWLQERMVYKPVETFAERIQFDEAQVRAIPSYHIECTNFPYLAWVADKARNFGWPVYPIAASHDAMLTMPHEVSQILMKISSGF